eukprot:Pompholyxophrys_punicea_v1_NODE_225_length_2691_cov_20.567147.p1 type:complete len:789 gc:universal NODE_225_length_2691_cov_20.567147:2426-60(-)
MDELRRNIEVQIIASEFQDIICKTTSNGKIVIIDTSDSLVSQSLRLEIFDLLPTLYWRGGKQVVPEELQKLDILSFSYLFLNFLRNKSWWKICEGVVVPELVNFRHFSLQAVDLDKLVFENGVKSCDCAFMFKPNRQYKSSSCPSCLHETKRILRAIQEKKNLSIDRQSSTSSVNFSLLSPESKNVRYRNLSKEVVKLRSLKNYYLEKTFFISSENLEHFEHDLDLIESCAPDQLEAVLSESTQLRDIWNDRKNFRLALEESWRREGKEKHGVRYNPLLIRIALAVYSRSPSAYHALQQFRILPLPSDATLKAYVRTYHHGAGIEQYFPIMKSFMARWDELMHQEKVVNPIRDVWIIFDEIKICAGVLWNVADNSVVGYSMACNEMADLSDLFQNQENSENETNYILLFLIRSAVYSFQMVGPHFTSSSPMSGEHIKACLLETVILFHGAGFYPSLCICDGASPNLSCLKNLMDQDLSAFRKNDEEIKPFATHFAGIEDLQMFFMICPPHMLKNMINALESSQKTGSKSFSFDSMKTIDWKFIYQAYYRQVERVKNGGIRQVRGLNSDAINRDSWSKMSVPIAKVFIHGSLTAEMTTHMVETGNFDAEKTISYLNHLEATFRNVFLNPTRRIYNMDDLAFEEVFAADKFFSQWRKNVEILQEEFHLSVENKNALFLAWQTYDLWRIMVHGFYGYCENFFQRHAQANFKAYLKPIRMSGSALELVFSALRQMKGDAASLNEGKFMTAKANYILHELNDIKTKNQYFGNSSDVQAQSSRKRASDLPLKRR